MMLILDLIKFAIIIFAIGLIGEVLFKITGKEILSDKKGSYSYPLFAITLILGVMIWVGISSILTR